jgi:hypothetical protein
MWKAVISLGSITMAIVLLVEQHAHHEELAAVQRALRQLEASTKAQMVASNTKGAQRAVEIAGSFAPSPSPIAHAALSKPDPAGLLPHPDEHSPSKASARLSSVESFAPIRDALELVFAEERMDPDWARDARREIEAFWSEKLPASSRLVSIDCLETICRIESLHDSELSANEFVNASLSDPSHRPWNGSFATGIVANDERSGRATLVTYFMRQGADLPPVQIDEP